MKKTLFAVLSIFAVILVFTACDTPEPPEESIVEASDISETESTPEESLPEESIPDTSAPETSKPETSAPETSEPETSEPDVSEPETSEPEVSEPEAYVWYGQEELDQWYAEVKESNGGDTYDGKHVRYYYAIDGKFIDEMISREVFENHYRPLAEGTKRINMSMICEYYGITKEEYMEVYTFEDYKAPYGEAPFVLLWNLDFYRFDAIFSDKPWDHPDYLLPLYTPPEIDDHYTEIADRNGYMRDYYIIDRLLIEYVGTDAFEQWLANTEDADQNIVEFVKGFRITREIYEDIYRETCFVEASKIGFDYKDYWQMLPYNPDYLFGTAEMQEEYFKVHPLNKE